MARSGSALAHSFTQLLIARAIAGIGAGLFSPIAASTAVALVGPKQKGRALGFILGGMGMGTVIGVPLGLLIAAHTSWQNVFYLVSVLGLIAFIGISIRLPKLKSKAPPSLLQRLKLLTNVRITETIGVTVLVSISSLGLYTYLSPIIHSSGTSLSMTPYLWVWGIGGIIGSFSIGSLIDLTGQPKKLMLIIIFVMAASMFILPHLLAYSIVGLIPFLLWGATGWSSQAPQQHTLLTVEPNHGAIAVALNSSANYLGSSIGAALGGVALTFGISATQLPYLAAVALLIAGIIQIFILVKKK